MKDQMDKENVHWTPSSNARRTRAPRRPKRKFALIAVPSTILVCGVAAGLAFVGMRQEQGDGLVDAARAVSTAIAEANPTAGATADATQAEPKKVTEARLEDGKGDKRNAKATTGPRPLSEHHPRWAEAAKGDEDGDDSEALKRKLVRMGHIDRRSAHTRTASIAEDSSDDDRTASIAGQTAYAEVPVADTDDEVAALESIMAPEEREPENTQEQPAPSGPEPVSWNAHATGLQAASAADAVHLRAQPGQDGRILTVVPKGASLKAEGDCADWCAVSYSGSKGWIYKDYLRFSQATASQAPTTAPRATPDAAASAAATEGADEAAAAQQAPLPAPTKAPTMFERTRNAR